MWLRDLDEGFRQASEQRKDVLICFTGHGWCYYCELLDREVFRQPEFTAATQEFVLVELDSPTIQESSNEAVKEQHATRKQKYLIRGIPTVVLTDAAGLPYAYTGYDDGLTAAKFLCELAAHRKARQARDSNLADADRATGLERARKLHAALGAVAGRLGTLEDRQDDPLLVFYGKEVDEILRLDADNAAGLRKWYDERRGARDAYLAREAVFRELQQFDASKDWKAAIEHIDRVLPTVRDAAIRWRFEAYRQTYLEWDRQHEAALANCRRLLQESPRSAEEIEILRDREIYNLCNLGRVDEALAIYDRQIGQAAQGSDARAHLIRQKASMAYSYATARKAIAACEVLRSVTEPGSDDWQLGTMMLAQKLTRENRHQEALALRRELLRYDPDSHDGLLLVAQSQQVLGMREEAIKSLDRAEQAAEKAFTKIERQEDKEARERFYAKSAKLRALLQ